MRKPGRPEPGFRDLLAASGLQSTQGGPVVFVPPGVAGLVHFETLRPGEPPVLCILRVLPQRAER